MKDYKREIDSQFPRYKCTSIIPGDELYERYHDKMPVFFVEDIYNDKYVNWNKNCNSDGEQNYMHIIYTQMKPSI